MKVLFVCTGNICRSPMAEVIFANLCEKNGRQDTVIKGAGTWAQNGEVMTESALEALRVCGEQTGTGPRPSTKWHSGMYYEFDYIVCMTSAHAAHVNRDRLAAENKKQARVCTLDEMTGCGEVPDPYMMPLDEYIKVCRQIQQACKVLYEIILK